jgi:integrase
MLLFLAKTGIRRKELIEIDIDNIDWEEQSIKLKPHPKRSLKIISRHIVIASKLIFY